MIILRITTKITIIYVFRPEIPVLIPVLPSETAPANVQTADVFLLQPQSSSTLAQREGDRLAARLTDIAMERSTHAINR